MNVRHWIIGITFFALLILLSGTPGSGTHAAGPDDVAWQIELTNTFTPAQTQQTGWNENTQARLTALATRLQSHGSQMQSTRQTGRDQTTTYTLQVNGKGTPAQLRQVIFDDLTPVGGLLAGPTALTLNGNVSKNETLTMFLESNLTTGYAWQIGSSSGVTLAGNASNFQAKSNLLGAPLTQALALQSTQDGAATLNLVYRRPWETSTPPTRRITLQASRLSAITDLRNPATPRQASADTTQQIPTRPVTASPNALPSSFDWRSSSKVPPIRDQGGCGSCWAFGSVGVFESAVMIKDNASAPNYSEQYLLSCNTDGWSCSGGWWAHNYHVNKTVPNDSVAGAINESSFPYQASNASCNAPYTHVNRLASWNYVAGEDSIPSVDAIKNAIYTYGPVAVGICAGNNFQSYPGGILSGNDTSFCNSNYGNINHAVILTGWNDSEGTWILRNSWGTGWGESGYARILRNISQVGYGASYVVYNGAPACYSLTTNASPSGTGSVNASPAPNCNGTQYTSGTAVTLTANPNVGYAFSSWSGNASGAANPTTVVMDGNKNVTANFSPTCYTLTVNKVPSSAGNVSVIPSPTCNGNTQYNPGTVVQLNATPNTGYFFAAWENSSINPARSVTMNAHTNVSAYFTPPISPRLFLPALVKGSTTPVGWVNILTENFEGTFPGAWNVYDFDGTTNGEYKWGKRTCRAYEGSYSGWGVGGGMNGAGLGCGSNYPNNADAIMMYGPFSLADATAADLKYKLWINTEMNYDYVCRWASSDGWNFDGYCTSGYSNGWIDRTLDLSNVNTFGSLLGQSNVWVALEFYSDSSSNYAEGGYVDNIVLRKCTSGNCASGGNILSPNSKITEWPTQRNLRTPITAKPK